LRGVDIDTRTAGIAPASPAWHTGTLLIKLRPQL
jgi:hypothetical protein